MNVVEFSTQGASIRTESEENKITIFVDATPYLILRRSKIHVDAWFVEYAAKVQKDYEELCKVVSNSVAVLNDALPVSEM